MVTYTIPQTVTISAAHYRLLQRGVYLKGAIEALLIFPELITVESIRAAYDRAMAYEPDMTEEGGE